MIVLVIVGSAAIHSSPGPSAAPLPPPRPGDGGDRGFVFRLLASLIVVVAALRIAGVNAGTLAVGGAFAAVLLGLAAQQSLGAIFAGIVLQTTRPFRVGERVRFVGGALAGSMEGTVTSLGLFYTTLSQGADRLQIPNNVLLNLAVVPLREPEKVDVRVRFPRHVSPPRGRAATPAHDHRPDPLPPERLARGNRPDGVIMRNRRHPAALRGRLAARRGGPRGAAPAGHRGTSGRGGGTPLPE